MKNLMLLTALALIATGCSKEDKPQAWQGTLPGTCSYSATEVYSGAIVSGDGPQTIAIAAKIVSNPMDRVEVILCSLADCAVSIPETYCASVPLAQRATTPCKATMPTVMVSWGDEIVQIQNAGTPGYSDLAHRNANNADIPAYTSYTIAESLCL